MRKISHRNAFTLIEILVVLIILSTLGAMVTTAVSGVRTTAREARTKRIISIVDSVIAEQYEQLRYRPLAVEIPDLYNFTPNGSIIGYEILADETARVRLMMLRDLQRMELPDRYTDITDAPSIILAAATLVQEQVQDGERVIVQKRDDKSTRRLFEVAWYKKYPRQPNQPKKIDNLPPKMSAYLNRLSDQPTEEHQGAECLYLILSTSYVGGQPAIGAIPTANIGDTDKDGMPEILDGWGQPLQYVRWPVGFTPSINGVAPNVDFELTVSVERPDDFDLFRADYAYATNSIDPAWATDVKNFGPGEDGILRTEDDEGRCLPWAMKPLVFSMGEDQESGLVLNPGDQPGIANSSFSYTALQWRWPVDVAHFGVEAAGRGTNPFPYIDPYLRRFIEQNSDGGLPGELLGSSPVELKRSLDQATDNITNYQLQVTP